AVTVALQYLEFAALICKAFGVPQRPQFSVVLAVSVSALLPASSNPGQREKSLAAGEMNGVIDCFWRAQHRAFGRHTARGHRGTGFGANRHQSPSAGEARRVGGTKPWNTAGCVAHSDGMPRRNSATRRRCLLTAPLRPSIAGACPCNGSVERS